MVTNSIDSEILVVGAGPAGALAAERAAQLGVSTTIIEQKARLDKSSACGGLVSDSTLDQLHLDSTAILNTFTGVEVFPSNGNSFRLLGQKKKAHAIERDQLNQTLATRAKKAGAEIETSTKLMHINEKKEAILKDLSRGQSYRTVPSILIGADGPQSTVRSSIGLSPPDSSFYGTQTVAKFSELNFNIVQVHFDSKLAPNFFAWVIPLDTTRARVGLATPEVKNAEQSLTNFLQQLDAREVESRSGGFIPIGPPTQTSSENVILAGDAAGQVKPTTGGGIFPILQCAPLAGRIAAEHVKNDNHSTSPAREYEQAWREFVGKRIQKELILHKIRTKATDQQMSQLLALLNEKPVSTYLETDGDIDHIFSAIRHFIKHPGLTHRIAQSLPPFVKKLLAQELMNYDWFNSPNS